MQNIPEGNYPLTVGMPSAQDQPEEITVKHGRFRVSRRYDPFVRIPDVILKSVGFIGEVTHRDSSGISGDLYGTGFFIAIPSSITGYFFFCFVTALHVVKDLVGREIYVLVNKKGGGVTALSSLAGSGLWTHPTDRSADVAVIPMGPDPTADYIAVAVNDFATPELIQAQNIGIGDEVVITGLFTPAPGTKRNMPIIRHGNIAMLPEEQIQTEMGYADVYLVEARSIGGLSGSPVFTRPTVFVQVVLEDGTTKTLHGIGDQYPLLGMMHSHWDIRESEINSPQVLHDRKRGVNLGIGIVVPASKIRETLYHPELVASRKEMEEMINKRSVPGVDSAKLKDKEAEQVIFTKEDFEAALKKASRKIPPKN